MPAGQRPPAPPNVIRVAQNGNVGGRPFTNVYHFQTDVEMVASSSVEDFITAVKNQTIASNIFANFSNSLHVTSYQGVVQIDADHAVEAQITASIDGGSSTTALPANECLVLSWLSNAYWRGGKPRTYLPGCTTSFIDTNHSLADSFKNSIKTAAESMRSGFEGITTPAVDQTTFGFLSYASQKVWRGTPLFVPFTGVTIHDRLGSQRRRLGPWLQ